MKELAIELGERSSAGNDHRGVGQLGWWLGRVPTCDIVGTNAIIRRRLAFVDDWRARSIRTSPFQETQHAMAPPIAPMRVGLGYDSHRLGNGGPLRIGGIDVPAEVHAIGHSDADVLLHAITDALLGSVAEDDIGRLFPDQDPENRGRDSADFLLEAIRRVRHHGMEIVNLDCVILAERPKMAPHIESMRAVIAGHLDLTTDRISIKAKTGEGIGPIGHAEAIAARVVVLVCKV